MSSFDWNEYGMSAIEAVALCIKNGVTPDQWAREAMELLRADGWGISDEQEAAMAVSIQESWDNFTQDDRAEWKALQAYDEATQQIIVHHFIHPGNALFERRVRELATALRSDPVLKPIMRSISRSEIERIARDKLAIVFP